MSDAPRARRTWRDWIKDYGLVVGTLATTVTLLITVAPQLPWFDGDGKACTSARRAAVAGIDLEPATYLDFVLAVDGDPEEHRPAVLAEPGFIARPRGEVHGLEAESVEVKWSLSPRPGTRRPPQHFRNQVAYSFHIQECNETFRQPFWIGEPPRGRYTVNVSVIDFHPTEIGGGGAPLASG